MQLENIDWLIISSFFILSLVIGVVVSKKSGKNITEFFLSGRKMPWWLLGISMVATTFSADTPNLVTDIVRTNGVAGNWVWWVFLLTGLLTVFVFYSNGVTRYVLATIALHLCTVTQLARYVPIRSYQS